MKLILQVLWIFLLFSCNSTYEASLFLGKPPSGSNAIKLNISKFFNDEDNLRRSFNFSFSPDGKELFFSYIKRTKEQPDPAYEVKSMKYIDGEWSWLQTAHFSGIYSDVDVYFHPDGKKLFYVSDKPIKSAKEGGIFYLESKPKGWSDPIYTGEEVNVKWEAYPSVSAKGNLFFQSYKEGGFGAIDLYRADWVDGKFTNVRNLGPSINTEFNNYHATISPDESYLIFSSNKSESKRERTFLVSFQIGDNKWTEPVSLGANVNEGQANAPTFSSDGKYLFYKKIDGIYWINTKFISSLRKP